jgi:glycosyltransferase involved in cell wall biosynthesis
MSKKIIIIGPAFPYRGGNSLFVTFLYEVLSKNYNVEVLNYKLLYPNLLFPGKTQFDLSNEVKKIDSLRLVNSINPFNWYKVAKYINKANPDLVIFDWWHPFFAFCHFTISSLLHKELKNKIVFITENFISHEKNLFESTLTRIGLKNAKYFIALSKKVENDLKLISGKRKIYRSELPVYNHLIGDENQKNEIRKKFNIQQNEKVLLFFGYVRKYKGLDLLFESLKILSETYQQENFKLVVAGEFYDDKNFYLNLLDTFNLKNKVLIFDEYIPNEKVKEFFIASDLVVLPYRSATQSGILNLSYGFNKPVVITDVGGLSEFVLPEITGIIAKEANPDSISKAILRFFEISEKVDFESNIRDYCSKNSFNSFTEIIKSILEEIERK